MAKKLILQDHFLNKLRQGKVSVSIYLVNGIKLTGFVKHFDQYVVMLQNTIMQMVYKHSISTIMPVSNVKLEFGDNEVKNDNDNE